MIKPDEPQQGGVSGLQHRSGSTTDCRPLSRRSYLGLLGGAGTTGLAGCLQSKDAVSVLAAGSLARLFEDHVGPAFERETGRSVHGEYHGSNALIRMVEDRTKFPDVIVSADATLLRDRLHGTVTDWDVEFATNSLGIGYDDQTAVGRALEDGKELYEVIRNADDGAFAISDPDLDPLGYRAVQAFELAQQAHGLDGLREELLALAYVEPDEPQLLAGVDAGTRAAAVVYRNMAVDHDVPFLDFPAEYSFADPTRADHYATVEYTTDDGYTARGRPIVYNTTIHEAADSPDAGAKFVQFLFDNPGLLVDAGLTVGEALPRLHGTPPATIDP